VTTYTYGTVAGSSYGITIAPETADRKPTTPSGLIVTQAVQTRDGWLGQVIVDRQIVWESTPKESGDAAVQVANSHVVEALKHLFQLVETNDGDDGEQAS